MRTEPSEPAEGTVDTLADSALRLRSGCTSTSLSRAESRGLARAVLALISLNFPARPELVEGRSRRKSTFPEAGGDSALSPRYSLLFW